MELFFGVPLLFVLFFVLVAGVILFAIVRGIVQFVQNSSSPIIETPARVVAKRSEVSRSGGRQSGGFLYTTYYVTFETESGERRELEVKGHQFGLLVEGDRGTLVSQGTWFKDFVRTAA